MFAIPTFKDLVQRSRAAFRVNLPGSDAWIWPNNINPTAKVIGGMTHEVFGFADYIQRQKFALTADLENLILHGEELGLSLKPAAPARGYVAIVATDAIAVDPLAVFTRADGVQYVPLAGGGALTGPGTLNVECVCVTDGKNGNAVAGTPLDTTSGVSGPGASAALASIADAIDGVTAVSGMVTGSDVEDADSFRARILFRKRNPPHGGSPADYIMWAGSVAGVSFYLDRPTVFVERLWAGPGTVRVFPLMFDLYDNGIPQSGDVQRVSDYLASVQPAGAKVTVQAPVGVPTDVVIAGLTPNRSDVQEAVMTELRATFKRLSRVAGTDAEIGGLPYLAYPTSFSRSWIWQAIANATGEERHALVAPAADIALFPGQMATLGNVSFV